MGFKHGKVGIRFSFLIDLVLMLLSDWSRMSTLGETGEFFATIVQMRNMATWTRVMTVEEKIK